MEENDTDLDEEEEQPPAAMEELRRRRWWRRLRRAAMEEEAPAAAVGGGGGAPPPPPQPSPSKRSWGHRMKPHQCSSRSTASAQQQASWRRAGQPTGRKEWADARDGASRRGQPATEHA